MGAVLPDNPSPDGLRHSDATGFRRTLFVESLTRASAEHQEYAMQIEMTSKGNYQIIKVLEDLVFQYNPFKLRHLVADFIAQGHSSVALAFTPETYASSRLLRVTQMCARMMQEHNGRLAVVCGDDSTRETFEILNLVRKDSVIVSKSVDDLVPADSAAPVAAK